MIGQRWTLWTLWTKCRLEQHLRVLRSIAYCLLPSSLLLNRLSLFTLEILHFTPDIAHWPGVFLQ